MLIHPDDLEELMHDGQVVTTMLEAVPLVLEASSHPCGVCVTLHIGVGIGSGGEGFGLIVTRVDAHLDDPCAQLGYAASDLTWHTSEITAPEERKVPPSSLDGEDHTARRACSSCGVSNDQSKERRVFYGRNTAFHRGGQEHHSGIS